MKTQFKFLLLIFFIFKSSLAFSQINNDQSNNIRDLVKGTFIKFILYDSYLLEDSRIFYLKIDLGLEGEVKNIATSDSIDSLFKDKFISNLNYSGFLDGIKQLNIKTKTIVVPIHFLTVHKDNVGNETIINRDSKNFEPDNLLKFNGIQLSGECLWLSPIINKVFK